MLTGTEPMKKKKGARPRKNEPEAHVDLPLVTLPPSVPLTKQLGSSSASTKKKGRPPGTLTEHELGEWLSGSAGMGFTPHAVRIAIGEDISSKVMSFSQYGPKSVCILSANGFVSNVTLCQNSPSGGTVTHEGCFEILSLSRSYVRIGSDSEACLRTGELCISLSSPDGRVFGGTVGGPLIAASPILVIAVSFMMKEKAEETWKIWKAMESELLTSREQLTLEKIARQDAEGKNLELKQQLDDALSVCLAAQNQLREKEVTLLAFSREMENIRADLGDAQHQIQELSEKISALEKEKAALTVELNNIHIPAACQKYLQKFLKSQAFVHAGAYINRKNLRAVMLQACEELRQFYPFCWNLRSGAIYWLETDRFHIGTDCLDSHLLVAPSGC